MKNIIYSKCVSFILFYLISSIIIVPNTGFSIDKYWIPEFPPKSNYEIKANIDITNHTIQGNEIITFINSAHEEINVLAFHWSISEKSTIKISFNGELLSLLNSNESGTVSSPLIYSLNSPIKPGEKAQFNVEFSSNALFKPTKERLLTPFTLK